MLGNIFRKLELENCGTTYVSINALDLLSLLMISIVSMTTTSELSLLPNSLVISAFLYEMSKINVDAAVIYLKKPCSIPLVGSNLVN